MYNSNKIAERIKHRAKEKGISIKKLLEIVGLGFNTMANMKTSMPKADNLAKIADYLNCSVDYLLGRSDRPGMYSENNEILEYYNNLNVKGKNRLINYAIDLSKVDEYKKCDTSEKIG